MSTRRLRALLACAAVLLPLVAAAPAAQAEGPVGGPLLGGKAFVVKPGPGATKFPQIAAESFVLADATTGEILAAKAAHVPHRPASTLKTLTAVTLIPRLDPGMVYTATHDDAAVEGSHVGIVPGATYKVHDLWNGLFLQSGNDAATALANANGGVGVTVQQMQQQAVELNARDTVVKNPSGLDADGQVSSAYDLALISRAGLQIRDFAIYCSRLSADFPGKMPAKPGAWRPTYKIYNQNRLLRHGYEGAIGVKTGYTTLAGRTFVGAATRDGRTLIVTLMRITEPTEQAARELLDWGFANAGRTTPVGVLVAPGELAQDNGASAAAVAASGASTATPAAAPAGAAASSAGLAGPGSSPWGPLVAGLVGLAALVTAGWAWTTRRRPAPAGVTADAAAPSPAAPSPATPSPAAPSPAAASPSAPSECPAQDAAPPLV